MPSSEAQVTSVPGTKSMPRVDASRAASSHPAVESWSVRATEVRPASAALRTTTAGGSVPSETFEWVWRSMHTGTNLLGAREAASELGRYCGVMTSNNSPETQESADQQPLEERVGNRSQPPRSS